MLKRSLVSGSTFLSGILLCALGTQDAKPPESPRAFIDGKGEGWRDLEAKEFVKVNCAPDTFTWKNGTVYCTGRPVGVTRTKEQFENFELSLEWRHMKDAGNSGVFIWTIPESIKQLEAGKGRLPQGIEVQVLDLGYKAQYEKGGKRKADWFTCHGDVFPVGAAKMKPFAPMAPNKKRSFPSKSLSRGTGLWNHYYIRAINGEVRLWVNGEEVSGGTDCQPARGYICLESEGKPVEFKNLRIRELP